MKTGAETKRQNQEGKCALPKEEKKNNLDKSIIYIMLLLKNGFCFL
jgi:hypothetical protein